VHNLYSRTGTEIVVIAVRGKNADYLRPFVIGTSERVENFFNTAIGHPVSDVALRMEAYCLLGAKGKLLVSNPISYSRHL
jgi:hypothetical protein